MPPGAPVAAIEALATALNARDYTRIAAVLHPEFEFIGYPDSAQDVVSWGPTEELRTWRSLFGMDDWPPAEEPRVALQSIDCTWVAAAPFTEPPWFPSSRWKFWATDFIATAAVTTSDARTLAIRGHQYVVVAQDPDKQPGEIREFLLYRWQDLGPLADPTTGLTGAEHITWTQLKSWRWDGGFARATSANRVRR